MKYIVHDCKKQNDIRIKLTFKQHFKTNADITTHLLGLDQTLACDLPSIWIKSQIIIVLEKVVH